MVTTKIINRNLLNLNYITTCYHKPLAYTCELMAINKEGT